MSKEEDLISYRELLTKLRTLYDQGLFSRLGHYDLPNIEYKKIEALESVTRMQKLIEHIESEGK